MPRSTFISSLVWLVSYYVAIAFSYTLVFHQPFYPIPPPFHIWGTQGVLFIAQTQCSFVPKSIGPKLCYCAQRGKESKLSLLPHPKKCYLHSCVYDLLTIYDIRKRKHNISLTISCELKTNIWAVIKLHETISLSCYYQCSTCSVQIRI